MEKLFGTDGVRGVANTYPITPEVIVKLGQAVAKVFRNNEKKTRILIGKDTRLSGYLVENALTSGICSMGVDVLLVGPIPTPAVSHLTKSFAADAGIMISASHNPAHHNGIKFFTSDGYKISKEMEQEVEQLVYSGINPQIPGNQIGKAFRIDDARGRYIEFVKSAIQNRNLSKIKVVLDCANGAAYSIAPDILRELGAEVIVLHNKPNGMNINDSCGSEFPASIQKVVKEKQADIGIAFDGDADRLIMCDENSVVVCGDELLCIYALHLLKNNALPNNTLVTTQYSNFGLDKTMATHGGKVLRVEAGEKNVIDAIVKNKLNFGGEFNGHMVFYDLNPTADATIACLKILDLMKQQGKKLSELASCFDKIPQILLNIDVKEKKDFNKMNSVLEAIRSAEQQMAEQGHVYVRYSGTEKLARVMVQGPNIDEVRTLANNIADKIKKEIGV